MAAEAGGVPHASGVSCRVTTRGEAMGVFRLRSVGSFACLLLCLGASRAVLPWGSRGSGPAASPKELSGQEAAKTLFSDAERAYRQKDYARARDLYESFLTNYPQSPLAEDGALSPWRNSLL